MKIKILDIRGKDYAMIGLSLSYNSEKSMEPVAERLKDKDNGENKFLEFIQIWLDITAPRFWWQQFDAYRMRTEQSESTMHTILKKALTKDDFIEGVDEEIIKKLNQYIARDEFRKIKVNLPEGFLQRRIVCMSIKELRRMYHQRKTHRLVEWNEFCEAIKNVEYIQ